MNTRFIPCAAAWLFFLLPFVRISSAADTNLNPALISGNNTFALELYNHLQSQDGNLFFSPYSISTCLAMTYAGARGSTAEQMGSVLHFNAGPAELAARFGALQKRLNEEKQNGGAELNIVNALWGQKDHPFLPPFLDVARNAYGANINQADFRTESEAVRKEINGWVSDQTKGKITDLLAPGVLNAATRLTLVNAIYFKGGWSQPFDKSQTTDQPFHVTAAQSVSSPFMHREASYRYVENNDFQLLELPYAAGQPASNGMGLEMVVILPKETNGVTRVSGLLTTSALQSWFAQARDQKVNVFLPKFKLTSGFELGVTLAAMGMAKPFSGEADFSGMDGAHDLTLSAVIHKAYVDVYEEGTEAAAATAVVVRMLAVMPQHPPPVFRADHPFLFLIRDRQSGSILFMGRVVDPTK